jgi:hypothetical protein
MCVDLFCWSSFTYGKKEIVPGIIRASSEAITIDGPVG